MIIHPEGNSSAMLRPRLECLFSMTLLEGGDDDEVTAIEVLPKGGGGGAIVSFNAEDLIVGVGEEALTFTSGAPVGTKGAPRGRAPRISTGVGELHLEAPSGVRVDGRAGPVIILAAAGVDVRAGGGARLRLGGAGGGIGASDVGPGRLRSKISINTCIHPHFLI